MIGIVGGMGPHAGLDLARKIMDNTVASEDQDHLPLLILSQPASIPDRSRFINGVPGAVNPGSAIGRVVQSASDYGSTLIGMACNTAHTGPIYEQIVASLDNVARGRLLHMIQEVARTIASTRPEIRKVGILATTATVNTRLYDKFLHEQSIDTIYLNEQDQHRVSEIAIRDDRIGIKAQSDPVTDEARGIVLEAIKVLASNGADAVLLACTELPLAVTSRTVDSVAVIDPTEEFARAIIKHYAPEKLKAQQ